MNFPRMGCLPEVTIFFLVVFAITPANKLYAQVYTEIYQPKRQSPYILFIVQDKLYLSLEQQINFYPNEQECAFVIVNGDKSTPENSQVLFNKLLNGNTSIDLQKVYLVYVGEIDFAQKFSQYKTDFFAKTYYLIHKLAEAPIANPPEYFGDYETTSLDSVVNYLSRSYTWKIQIDEIEEEHVKELGGEVLSTKFSLGFQLGPLIPFASEDSLGIPSSFMQYTFTGGKFIKPRLSLNASFSFGADIPNPQTLLQDQLFSQIDIFSIFSGGGEEQEININADINGHVYLNGSLEARYYLGKSQKYKPYIGAGISYTNFTNFDATIDTTIILDPGEIFSGGGFGGGTSDFLDFDRDSFEERDDFEVTEKNFIGIPLRAGINVSLGDRWVFEGNASYNLDPASLQGNKLSMNTLSINAGLSFRFINRSRSFKFIEYVRFK